MGVLLQMIVERLSARPHVALARVWLIRPGDLCERCARRQMCPDPTRCLHLAASGGAAPAEGDSDLRVPIGVGTLGLVASTGRACRIEDTEEVQAGWRKTRGPRASGILGFLRSTPRLQGRGSGRARAVHQNPPHGPERGNALGQDDRQPGRHFHGERARLRGNRAPEEEARTGERLSPGRPANEVQAFGDILGQSAADPERRCDRSSWSRPTDASVLILGESGTGKELVASEIHRHSRRERSTPDPGQLRLRPPELFESEFFGHVKGAFTGRAEDRIGRFELPTAAPCSWTRWAKSRCELQAQAPARAAGRAV